MKTNDNKKNIYFITGGGTGGHVYPALTIAKELMQDNKVYFVGKKGNLEERLAKAYGLEFLSIDIDSMPRTKDFSFFLWGIKTLIAGIKALFYTLNKKPDVVFATGGYVSFPSLFAAKLLKIPYMLHEADIEPGIVTKTFSKEAKIVSVAFSQAKENIVSSHVIVNGNPIRNSFELLTKKEARKKTGLEDKITVFAMGGSGGSENINFSTAGALKILAKELNVQVIMQTGVKRFKDTIDIVKQIYPNFKEDNKGIIIKPYFDDMSIPLNAADIVISRSGSLSLSEISAVGLCAILVPYPKASADHQRKNAKVFSNAQAAIYIEDEDFNVKKIKEIISDLISNPEKIQNYKEKISTFAKLDAKEKIVEQLKSIIQ